MALIDVRNLGKTYRTVRQGDVHALQDVSFTVEDGEFVAIVGPSGCGKSTMLKILAGLLPGTGGTATLAGASMDAPSAAVGMVFQAPVLLPWRTIYDNVTFPVEVRRQPASSYRQRALDLLGLVGLADFADRYPHELSGGMQQRAAIVRALVQDPKVLLMDEPFGALDAMTREQMNLELLRIWEAHRKTVLFVTHSITESIFLADRVLVMTPRPGRLTEILRVDLPRPRRLEMINSDAFGAYAKRVRELLQTKGDLS